MTRVYVIAEASLNHDGSLQPAWRLLRGRTWEICSLTVVAIKPTCAGLLGKINTC